MERAHATVWLCVAASRRHEWIIRCDTRRMGNAVPVPHAKRGVVVSSCPPKSQIPSHFPDRRRTQFFVFVVAAYPDLPIGIEHWVLTSTAIPAVWPHQSPSALYFVQLSLYYTVPVHWYSHFSAIQSAARTCPSSCAPVRCPPHTYAQILADDFACVPTSSYTAESVISAKFKRETKFVYKKKTVKHAFEISLPWRSNIHLQQQ